MDNLSNVILKREGLLRIECKNCELNYQVNDKDYKVAVEGGSNDVTFSYSGDFGLKTQLVSKEDQPIRLLVMDAFGRVVSNELNNWSKGEVRNRTFNINIH